MKLVVLTATLCRGFRKVGLWRDLRFLCTYIKQNVEMDFSNKGEVHEKFKLY